MTKAKATALPKAFEGAGTPMPSVSLTRVAPS